MPINTITVTVKIRKTHQWGARLLIALAVLCARAGAGCMSRGAYVERKRPRNWQPILEPIAIGAICFALAVILSFFVVRAAQ